MMLEHLEPIRDLAVQTRADFKHGLVTDDEIIEAAVAFDEVFSIKHYLNRDEVTEETAANFYEVGVHQWLVSKNRVNPEQFPEGHCNDATLVLKRRIEAADILEGNLAKVIHGGCGFEASHDWEFSNSNIHTFLGIGRTILGSDTIVDITGSQFSEVIQPVYIGPLVDPWTRDPRIDLWEV